VTHGGKSQAGPGLEPNVAAQVRALDDGRGLVDLSWWRKVLVTGSDAPAWLNDLLAADLAGMAPGDTRRSVLLSPTGRLRADVSVVRREDGHLFVQHPSQPDAIDALLSPYVLSSDVALEDRTPELAILALPGRDETRTDHLPERWEASRPSCLGAGTDLIGPAQTAEQARSSLEGALPDLVEATNEAVGAWRIIRGVPRFPVDLTPESLPHETDLGAAVAYEKGCYLGQEAVARVRNLGHPPFLLIALRARGPVSAGDAVLADGADSGIVTSATPLEDGGTALIARVRWAARQGALRTSVGEELMPLTRPSSSASA
jgi:tRNA-modifying protein YgfZ